MLPFVVVWLCGAKHIISPYAFIYLFICFLYFFFFSGLFPLIVVKKKRHRVFVHQAVLLQPEMEWDHAHTHINNALF